MHWDTDLSSGSNLPGECDLRRHVYLRPSLSRTDNAGHTDMSRIHDLPRKLHLPGHADVSWVRNLRRYVHLPRFPDLPRVYDMRGFRDVYRQSDMQWPDLRWSANLRRPSDM